VSRCRGGWRREDPHSLHTAEAIGSNSFKQQEHNRGVTEIVELKGRGHALTIDHGWPEVADTTLQFIKRFTS
jgi:hypothetical protein